MTRTITTGRLRPYHTWREVRRCRIGSREALGRRLTEPGQQSDLHPVRTIVEEEMAEQGKSIRWIVIWSSVLLVYLAWGFMAGSFAGSTHGVIVTGRRRPNAIGMLLSALYTFVITSILELPNFLTVIGWTFQNRIWIPILFLMLEIGLLAGGYGLQKLEQNLSAPRSKRRR
ncbi:MAG: hypothetical protein KDA85_03060 [Planctomycetaceae bacterium]|nr:hypothetical protein [Planctomycetaceae bacterium]